MINALGMELTNLDYLFNPKSIAVIGASSKPGTIGRAIMENLITRYSGKIFPVNLKYDEVMGIKCFKSITNITDEVDLAVIAIPAKAVPRTLEECGKKKVKAVIVISAGFKETGPEGAKLEEEAVNIAKKYGLRILGPNCLGVYDAHTGLDTIFNPNDRQSKPASGSVAFISQSGALGAAILDWMAEANIGMSKFVSYGNAADIKEYELIEYLAEDPNTSVISAYIEGVVEGRKFLLAIKKSVCSGKPVVVLKAGKSTKGMSAVASHTGSLAGKYEMYESALRQFGAIVVNELKELIAAVKALSWLPKPEGDRIAIITNGGGAGVLATDAVELFGLRMAELNEKTMKYLKNNLPPAAAVGNPVDVLGDAPPQRYKVAIECVMRDNGVDALLVIGIMQSPAFNPEGVLNVLKDVKNQFNKPVVMVAPGGKYTEVNLSKIEQRTKIPTYKTPEEGVRALKYLVEWSRISGRLKTFC
jgi:acetyl coenzyme A synthetase (ADP forming)-like protein